ncbi:MAG: ferritin family protein [Desulfuromonadaceae bacterium]
MNQPPNLQQAILSAMQTEKDAMDFYRLVAEKMSDPQAAERFSQLAREERQHAHTFFHAYRGGDIHSFEEFLATPPRVDSEWWKALRQLEAQGFTERSALHLAIERERSLEKELRYTADTINRPEVKAIFLANASSTHNHCRSIALAYAEKYSQVATCCER